MVLGTLLGIEFPSLVLLIVALLVILIVRSWSQVPANLPPFPGRAVPVLGHLTYLGRSPREKLLAIREQVGDIFSMYFGDTLVIFLSSYDVMKEAFIKQADNFSDRPKGGPSRLLGFTDGIIANSGAVWKQNRTATIRILKDFFAGRDIMSQEIMEEVKLYVDALASKAGKAQKVRNITSLAVSNVTFKFLCGKRYEYDDHSFEQFLHLLDTFMSNLVAGGLHQWFPILKSLPGDLFSAKGLINQHDEIFSRCKEIIAEVRTRDARGEGTSNLISSYLEKIEELRQAGQDTDLSESQLVRVVFDLVIGGSETSTTTLTWFYLYMIHFPDVQDKVYEEILREVGTSRLPKAQDKPKLHYLNATILETQRLATISPFAISHRCSKQTVVRGFTIPEDACIFPHLDSVLLDERVWPDAMTFRPGRFLKDGELDCPEQFIAFGLGRRSCMGEDLGRMELFLFAVSVIQRFRIVADPRSGLPPRTYVQGSTCPPTPYKACFVERERE